MEEEQFKMELKHLYFLQQVKILKELVVFGNNNNNNNNNNYKFYFILII